jgi:hypothetical protein
VSCIVLYLHDFHIDFQSFVNKLKIIRKNYIIGYPKSRIPIVVIIVSDKIHVKLDIHFWWKSQLMAWKKRSEFLNPP